MLTVKYTNRANIKLLLKSNFLKPKVANYISDFKKNYKLYDGNQSKFKFWRPKLKNLKFLKIYKNNTEIRDNSIEKDKKIKKNNFKLNKVRRDSFNPISPEKDEKPKK